MMFLIINVYRGTEGGQLRLLRTTDHSRVEPPDSFDFKRWNSANAEVFDFPVLRRGRFGRLQPEYFRRSHVTSLSAAWLNIVYGFGGLRSDGKYLKSRLSSDVGERLKFRIRYRGLDHRSRNHETDTEIRISGESLELQIYDRLYMVDKSIKVKTGGPHDC